MESAALANIWNTTIKQRPWVQKEDRRSLAEIYLQCMEASLSWPVGFDAKERHLPMTNQSGSKKRSTRSIEIPWALVLIFMLSPSAIAQAQRAPADTLKGLVSRVRLYDHVQIVDKNGEIIKGEVDEISETFIRLHVPGKLREFPESQIREILLKRPKPKVRRALIGAAIGAVAGVSVALVAFDPRGEEYSPEVASLGILFGLGGIGVAELMPANKHDTVFRAPPAAAGLRVNLSPLVSGKRKGAALSFSF